MEYYASSRYGRLSELPTVHSVYNVWGQFSGHLKRDETLKIDAEIARDVGRYIHGKLKLKLGLSTRKTEKYLVTRQDLDILQEHLWCSDDHDYLHERYRVQLGFMLILFCSTGARAGAVVESSSYRGTNQALAYKDCHIHQLRKPDGSVSFILEIVQRFCKGRRKDEDQNVHITLRSTNRLQYNGLLFFFALAIADKALKGYETLDDLMKARLPPGRESWELQLRDAVRELPVLRMATARGVNDHRALTYAALWAQVVSLGERVGYKNRVKVHAIRAGVANRIENPEKRQKMLDHHNPKEYGKSYSSRILDLDPLSEFLGETPSTEHIEMLQSMSHQRDKNAPRKLPAKERLELEQSADVTRINKLIADATKEIAGAPDKHPALFKKRQQLYNDKRNIFRAAFKVFRNEWFSSSYDIETLRQVEQDLGEEEKEFPDLRTAGSFAAVRHLLPARDRLATSLLASGDLQSEKGQSALRDLYSLCVDDSQVAYRPDERPAAGICPCEGCGTYVTSLDLPSRSKHIHSCRQRELRDNISQQPGSYSRRLRNRKLPFAEYCYACCEWSTNEKEWDNHCQRHLENPSVRCGLLSFRYTLVTAGYCPFCLGNDDLPATRRMQQWMQKSTLLNHIDAHLQELAESQRIPCPHPLCQISFDTPLVSMQSNDVHPPQPQRFLDFWAHLYDVHSIEKPRSNCISRKRQRGEEK